MANLRFYEVASLTTSERLEYGFEVASAARKLRRDGQTSQYNPDQFTSFRDALRSLKQQPEAVSERLRPLSRQLIMNLDEGRRAIGVATTRWVTPLAPRSEVPQAEISYWVKPYQPDTARAIGFEVVDHLLDEVSRLEPNADVWMYTAPGQRVPAAQVVEQLGFTDMGRMQGQGEADDRAWLLPHRELVTTA